MDSAGVERYRIEGYLPKAEFRPQLESALGRLAFKAKNWSEAENVYGGIVERYPNSSIAPEAQYWKGVSEYQRTHDPKFLNETGKLLTQKYPDNVWTKKASVWL